MDKVITREMVQQELYELRRQIETGTRRHSYNASDRETAWYILARDHFPELLPIIDEVCGRVMPGTTTFYQRQEACVNA